jgi:hypothetical protein
VGKRQSSFDDNMNSSQPKLPIMGGTRPWDKSGNAAVVLWIMQSRTAVLRKTSWPRHERSSAVAKRVVRE